MSQNNNAVIKAFDDILKRIPKKANLLFFPVRLETHFRYKNNKKELCVRIFPDEICLNYKGHMTDEEIKSGLEFVCKYASAVAATHVTVCWHGGEPFLLTKRLPDILEYANALFARYGLKLSHGTQTNATLLTPKTYDLVKHYFDGFVGVSIDLFSSYRKFPSGKDSQEIAIHNIDAALSEGIRCGAINLLTKDNVERIDEIYDFYKVRDMNVRLARVFPISDTEDTASSMYLTDEEYANAMIRFFDRWVNDPQPANNTDIVKLVADLLLGTPSICLREPNCHERYMAFSPGGDIFSCAEFDVPESCKEERNFNKVKFNFDKNYKFINKENL